MRVPPFEMAELQDALRHPRSRKSANGVVVLEMITQSEKAQSVPLPNTTCYAMRNRAGKMLALTWVKRFV